MAKVIATQRGYHGRMLREAGDVFIVPDGATASWWHPVGEADATEPAADAEQPRRRRRAEAPARVDNEINAATGQTQPDWFPSQG